MMGLVGKGILVVGAAAVLAAPMVRAQSAATVAELRRGFEAPPNEAKPMVRWWWFGPAVEKAEILRELQQMKADGIQGAELAFVYPEVLDDAARGLKNLPFLSPEMLDAVNYAQAEGRKLGLRIDVTLCSGWPYGGPATTLEEAAGRLKVVELPVAAGATSVPLPKLMDGDKVISTVVVKGEPKKWDAASAKALDVAASLKLEASQEARVVVMFVQSHTRQQVKRAAVGAEGWVLDPFSREAVATHLKAVGEPLVGAFGKTPPYAIFSDSLEAYGADWTPRLPEEFKRRRGYDLIPHLPELVAGGTPEAEKLRHDWGKTLTEMVNENYLVQINDWARARGTKFRSQTYGEPAVSLSSQRLVDLAEGEGPQWRAFSTLRWATSGNHVFGRSVTSGETFTWLHSPVFRATPLDMKAEADIDFVMGENQLMFHGWPYSAPQVGEPGWSLYAAAVFNDHNPWHPVMPSVTGYIARLSYVLRQGEAANQVAVLLPTDDAWAGFSPGKVTVTGAMQKLMPREVVGAILSAGYNFDFIDADAVDRVGVKYEVLVLPPTDRIPVATLKKINAWREKGGKVWAVGKLPTMDDEGRPLPGGTKLTEAIPVVGGAKDLGKALGEAQAPDFRLSGVSEGQRDVVGFIRRKVAGGDVYFVTNTSNVAVAGEVAFATAASEGARWDPDTGSVVGAVNAKGERLHLEPYESALFVFGAGAGGKQVPRFARNDKQEKQQRGQRQTQGQQQGQKQTQIPFGNDKQERGRTIADLSGGWKVSFAGMGRTEDEATLKDWTEEKETLHYSGEGVYARDFDLSAVPAGRVMLAVDGGKAEAGAPNSPPEHGERDKYDALPNGMPNPLVTRPGPGMRAWYEGPVREAALVTVNGNPVGALWHPPYALDVTGMLKAGKNHVEIRVFNTAMNAWSAQAPHDYKPLIAKYGDRFQMQDLDKVKPIPSGLVGTVRLVEEAK